MLKAIAIILAALWAVGLVSGARVGLWLHGFLLASLASAAVSLLAQRRQP